MPATFTGCIVISSKSGSFLSQVAKSRGNGILRHPVSGSNRLASFTILKATLEVIPFAGDGHQLGIVVFNVPVGSKDEGHRQLELFRREGCCRLRGGRSGSGRRCRRCDGTGSGLRRRPPEHHLVEDSLRRFPLQHRTRRRRVIIRIDQPLPDDVAKPETNAISGAIDSCLQVTGAVHGEKALTDSPGRPGRRGVDLCPSRPPIVNAPRCSPTARS